mgnify:CR=1 FL=1
MLKIQKICFKKLDLKNTSVLKNLVLKNICVKKLRTLHFERKKIELTKKYYENSFAS